MTMGIVLSIVIITLIVVGVKLILKSAMTRGIGVMFIVVALIVLIVAGISYFQPSKQSSQQLNTTMIRSEPKENTSVTSAAEARLREGNPDVALGRIRAVATPERARGGTEEGAKPPILRSRSAGLGTQKRGAVRRGARFSGIPVVCKPQDECNPPQEFIYSNAPHPFNVRVTYGGEKLIHLGNPSLNIKPTVYWKWIKAENPSVPCSAAQLNEGASYEYGCKAKVGEVLFITPKFLLEESRELRRASAQDGVSLPKGDAFEFPIAGSHSKFRMNLLITTLGCQFTGEVWRRRDGVMTEIAGLNFPCEIPSSMQYSLGHDFQEGDTLVLPYRPNILIYEADRIVQIPRISMIDNISNDTTPIYGARVKW